MSDDYQDYNLLEEGLIHAGVFHPDDLEFNDAGDLSPAQKRWLTLEAAFWLTLAGLEIGLVVTMWVFYFLHHIETVLLLSITWGSFLVMVANMCVIDARPILEELRDGKVDEIAGTVSKHYPTITTGKGRYRVGHYSIEISGHLFDVHDSVYALILEHHSYRLFYTPRNKTLVNIEPLLSSDQKRRSALAALQQHV